MNAGAVRGGMGKPCAASVNTVFFATLAQKVSLIGPAVKSPGVRRNGVICVWSGG